MANVEDLDKTDRVVSNCRPVPSLRSGHLMQMVSSSIGGSLVRMVISIVDSSSSR